MPDASAGQDPAQSTHEHAIEGAERPIVRDLSISGVTVFGRSEILRWTGVEIGATLPSSPSAIAAELQKRYEQEGFSYAKVSATFDEAAARLDIVADEGRIDAIEFAGVDERMTERFTAEFDVRVGDVFNRRDVARAVRGLLGRTQGSFEAAPGPPPATTDKSAADLDRRSLDASRLVPREGQRVLVVTLRKREGRFHVSLANDREDWYSPVDGFAPALRFEATAFEHAQLNHTFVSGQLSYKFAREDAGYSLGFERPLFAGPKLFLGAEIHELTASDDAWRLSSLEQSLVAFGFRNTFKDYYERRGYQTHAVLRATPFHEIGVVFRDERHDAVGNTAEYTLFRRDHAFRQNAPAASGRLRAIVVGYLWDSRSLEHAGVAAAYRRHLFDDLFGTGGGNAPGWRLEWTTELSSPDGLNSDFDFKRHILNLRRYSRISPRQDLDVRVLLASSTGTLPPQRRFALGGIGTVRGYEFKEVEGERMALVNVEFRTALLPYRIANEGMRGLLFVDTGRVFRPLAGSRADWLTGVGTGIELGGALRIELGWRTDGGANRMTTLLRLKRAF